MLVTTIVFFFLAALGTTAMAIFLPTVLLQMLAAKGMHALDRHLRWLRAEQYLQVVALPLIASIVGGLIGSAIPIWVQDPPWKNDTMTNTGYLLLGIALVVALLGPLALFRLHANPQNLQIGLRIDRLKDGDFAGDSKADVLKTVDNERAAVKTKLASGGRRILVLMAAVVAADAGWIILDHAETRSSPTWAEVLLMAASLATALAAWHFIRPTGLQGELKVWDEYYAEAQQLTDPVPAGATPPIPMVVHRHTHHHHYYAVPVALGGAALGALAMRLTVGHTARPRPS